MDSGNSDNNVLDILKTIEFNQNCDSCSNIQQLGVSKLIYNTIPIILICKNNCNCYISSGIFKDPSTDTFKCFETPVFRVSKLDIKNKTVLLELLQPQTIDGEISSISCINGVCKFFSSVSISKFIRTGISIKVDIDCFCGVECLQPICAKCETPKGISDNPQIIDVETSEYVTISDGIKKVYYNSDGIEGFNKIPDPLTISYSNLFVNGVLQPPSFYTFIEGQLTLNTEDIPILGAYIILQLIKINR